MRSKLSAVLLVASMVATSVFLLPGQRGTTSAPDIDCRLVWTSTGDNEPGALFGQSLDSAGDVNGDGFDDIVLGAFTYSTNQSRWAGKAYLYLGGPGGPSITPSWTSIGDNGLAAFYGGEVSGVGDVNGDGYDDVMIGEPYFRTSYHETGVGKAFLYLGGPDGLNATPAWTSIGEGKIDSTFGSAIASAGDVNHDGYGDVLIAAGRFDTDRYDVGKVYLYLGGPGGLSGPVWSSVGDGEWMAFFGEYVASGDFNGDNLPDVVVGDPLFSGNASNPGDDEGRVYAYYSGARGLPDSPNWTTSGDTVYRGLFGRGTSVGDVNRDGFDDVLAGSPLAYDDNGQRTGKVFLYPGGPGGLSVAPNWTSVGEGQLGSLYGHALDLQGDANGDGYADPLVAAIAYNTPESVEAGKVYLYLGGKDGVRSAPSWSSTGNNTKTAHFGWALAYAGNVDGKRGDEILVGEGSYGIPSSRTGRAFLYSCTSQSPLQVNAGPDRRALEGETIGFSANVTGGASGNLTYAWDFDASRDSDGDGNFTNDVDSTLPSPTHVYGDNGVFTATVTVCDSAGACGSDSVTITVMNVPPSIQVAQAYVVANATLRVAGEKWHDVRMDLVWKGNVTGSTRVVRMPGSPDRQSGTITGAHLQLLGDFAIILTYTPADDKADGPPNGANPAWVILTFPDGSEVRLHHTFNVQHEQTWVWTITDLAPFLVGKTITFEATAHDVGSDDLTFAWSFGDGSPDTSIVYYNNGVGPDPYPSPEVNPITAADDEMHAFGSAETYTVSVAVTDDDGGAASVTFTLAIG